MAAWVTVDGYIVRQVAPSGQAVAIVKEGAGFMPKLIWLPVSLCLDGDELTVGDTDIEVMEFKAEELGLDY